MNNRNSLAVCSGLYPDLTIAEVRRRIQDQTILDFLQKRMELDFDIGLLTPGEKMELLSDWEDMELAIDARRKRGIEEHGLTLLLAYVLESIQRAYQQNLEQRRLAELPIIEDVFRRLGAD